MEAGLVFDKTGGLIYWHVPANRSAGALPDSRELWEILWLHRDILGGVAHTHPWHGPAEPSTTDVTTFAAIEQGLGQRLVWPVVTFSEIGYYVWIGPEPHDYDLMEQRRFRIREHLIDRLRELSGGDKWKHNSTSRTVV